MARSQTASSKKKTVKKKRSTVADGSGGKNRGTLKTPRDVRNALFAFMCDELSFGMNEWTREYLAHSVGFGNPRTEKFAKGLKILVSEEAYVGMGKKKGAVCLTPLGIANKIANEDSSSNQPKTLADFHDRFIAQLERKATKGAGKVRGLWKILEDRKPHTTDEIAKRLGYTNKSSFGNTKLLVLMDGMGLVTRTRGSVTMTDKAFPNSKGLIAVSRSESDGGQTEYVF